MKRKIWDVAPRRNGADGRYNVQERAGRTAFTIGRARRSLELGHDAGPRGQVRVKDHHGRI
jgi:hypothetical protein